MSGLGTAETLSLIIIERNGTMKQRTITGLLLAALFIPVLFFSHTWFFRLVLAVLSGMCVLEMHITIGCSYKKLLVIPAFLIAVTAPFLANFMTFGTLLSIVAIYLVYCLFTMVLSNGEITAENACVSYATTAFIALSFASIVLMRNLEPAGYVLYIMVFVGGWMCDVSAYFSGVLFGKHKLIPKISPKKTVEGAIGGVVGSVVSILVFAFLAANIKKVIPFFPIDVILEPNYPMLALAGVGIAIVSQFGDLTASAIKRCYNVKDYGWIFPGHGGVMDRFDSILAVAPLLYMFARKIAGLF